MSRIIEPLGNHVLVEPDAVPDKVGEGIIVKAEAWKQPSNEGTVVAVGPGIHIDGTDYYRNHGIQTGDRVIFSWINGKDVAMDGKTYKLLDAAEILGKIKTI